MLRSAKTFFLLYCAAALSVGQTFVPAATNVGFQSFQINLTADCESIGPRQISGANTLCRALSPKYLVSGSNQHINTLSEIHDIFWPSAVLIVRVLFSRSDPPPTPWMRQIDHPRTAGALQRCSVRLALVLQQRGVVSALLGVGGNFPHSLH